MARFTDEELMRKVQDGFIVESEADMTDSYKRALIIQLTVQGDTELISAPAYYMAAQGRALDQHHGVGHGHHPGRARAREHRLPPAGGPGHDPEGCCTSGHPRSVQAPVGFDQPLANWAELVTANGLYDRAGITLLGDVLPQHLLRAPEAGAREGRTWRRTSTCATARCGCAGWPSRAARPATLVQRAARLDVPDGRRVVRDARRPEAAQRAARLQAQGHDERPAPGRRGSRPWCRCASSSARRAGALRPGHRRGGARVRVPLPLGPARPGAGCSTSRSPGTRSGTAGKDARPDERGVRRVDPPKSRSATEDLLAA